MFQKTADYPDQHAFGYHVVLDDEVVTMRQDQVGINHVEPWATVE